MHFRDKKIDADVDVDVVARGTPGMSGADLANLVNEAALFAVRRGAQEVHADDFDAARDRVLMGLKRESMALSEEEKEIVAYHEGGHAVLAYVLEHADPVHKVTILPDRHGARRHPAAPDRGAPHLQARVHRRLARRAPRRARRRGARLRSPVDRRRRTTSSAAPSSRARWCASGACPTASARWRGARRARCSSARTSCTPATTPTRPRASIDEEVERILRDEEDRCRKVLTEYRRRRSTPWPSALLERETLDGEEVADLVDDAMGRKVGGPRMIIHADGTEVVAEPLPDGESLTDLVE